MSGGRRRTSILNKTFFYMYMLENGLFCGNLEDFREMVCVCSPGRGGGVMVPVILSFDQSLA